ncbi:MAG: hypothetical protein HC912_12790 [Saprospiraceae bacterium]|nr:hypothetical protein [Saprospiraceae bacterium]
MRLAHKVASTLLSIAIAGSMMACGGGNGQRNDTNVDTASVDSIAEALPKITIDTTLTQIATFMGGLALQPNTNGFDSLLNTAWAKTHYQAFEESWKPLEEQRLSKMREWRASELKDFQQDGNNLFYPFSGPDFLNAYEFFPNCDNYLMFGLEPAGFMPNKARVDNQYLLGIRKALNEIFKRNYFITSFMGGDLSGKGVLPIVMTFMARTGNQIVSIDRFYIEKDGGFKLEPYTNDKIDTKQLNGLSIEFYNPNRKKTQRVWYIGTDVVDGAMANKQELVAFIKSFPNKITFVKSASYTLHSGEFSTIRNLILEDAKAVLQDDTGIRYEVYQEAGWSVQLYGKYARPIADFGGYTYQNALAQAFRDSTQQVRPLNFTYGYHWNTDNTSVLICRKQK